MKYYFIIYLLLILCFYQVACSQTPQQKHPSSEIAKTQNSSLSTATTNGKRLTDPYGGYSFQLPEGWSSKQEQGGFVLTSIHDAVGFAVAAHNYKSKEELLSGVEDIVDEASDTYLHTRVSDFGKNGVLFHLEGRASGQQVILQIISTISPHGGGVSFTSGGEPGVFKDEHTGILKFMANSVQFSKHVLSSAAQQWQNQLKGKQLLYLHTSGGGSERITINLYQNGEYTYSNNSSYLSGGSSTLSYAGRDGNSGTWKIQSRNSQSVLVLFGNDRTITEYILTTRSSNGEINLNDRRYFLKSL